VAGLNPVSYEQRIRDSWLWKELYKVRNIRPSFNTSLGMYGGLLYTGTVWYLTQGREPWTFSMHTNKGPVCLHAYVLSRLCHHHSIAYSWIGWQNTNNPV